MIVASTVDGPGRPPQRPSGPVLVASTTAVRRRCLDTGVTTTAQEKIAVFGLRSIRFLPASSTAHHAARPIRSVRSAGPTGAVTVSVPPAA
jgi:hypothetical protein